MGDGRWELGARSWEGGRSLRERANKLGFPNRVAGCPSASGLFALPHSRRKVTLPLVRAECSLDIGPPQSGIARALRTALVSSLYSIFVSRQLPLRSTATSRLCRPCRSSHSLHSSERASRSIRRSQ